MKRGRGATQPTQDTQDDFNLTQAQQGSQGDTAHFLEAGYIKDVRAVNFMCHSNLRAELRCLRSLSKHAAASYAPAWRHE